MADLSVDHIRNKLKKRFQEAARQLSTDVLPPAPVQTISVVYPHDPPPETLKAIEPPRPIEPLLPSVDLEKVSAEYAKERSAWDEEVRGWMTRCRTLENDLAAAREQTQKLERELDEVKSKRLDEGVAIELQLTIEKLQEQMRTVRVLDEKLRQAEERAAAAERAAAETAKHNTDTHDQSNADLHDLHAQLEEARAQRASLRESFRRAEQEASSWRQRFADLEDRFSRQGKELLEVRMLFQSARAQLEKMRSDAVNQPSSGPMPDVPLESKPAERSIILSELELKFNRQSKIIQEIQRAKEELEQTLDQKDKDQRFLTSQVDRMERQNRELMAKLSMLAASQETFASPEARKEMEQTHRDLLNKLSKLEDEGGASPPAPKSK